MPRPRRCSNADAIGAASVSQDVNSSLTSCRFLRCVWLTEAALGLPKWPVRARNCIVHLPDWIDDPRDCTNDLLDFIGDLPDWLDDLLGSIDDLPDSIGDLLDWIDHLFDLIDDLPDWTDDLPDCIHDLRKVMDGVRKAKRGANGPLGRFPGVAGGVNGCG
jgi:hypothetical protein